MALSVHQQAALDRAKASITATAAAQIAALDAYGVAMAEYESRKAAAIDATRTRLNDPAWLPRTSHSLGFAPPASPFPGFHL